MHEQAVVRSGKPTSVIAAETGVSRTRYREWLDAEEPATIPLADVFALPVEALEHMRDEIQRTIDLLKPQETAASLQQLALEALQTIPGTIAAAIDVQDPAASKHDISAALSGIHDAIHRLEQIATKLVGEPRPNGNGNVRPIRNGER